RIMTAPLFSEHGLVKLVAFRGDQARKIASRVSANSAGRKPERTRLQGTRHGAASPQETVRKADLLLHARRDRCVKKFAKPSATCRALVTRIRLEMKMSPKLQPHREVVVCADGARPHRCASHQAPLRQHDLHQSVIDRPYVVIGRGP